MRTVPMSHMVGPTCLMSPVYGSHANRAQETKFPQRVTLTLH